MATGIRRRHSSNCRSHTNERCNCGAGYEASVFDRRSGQRVRKTFDRESDAKAWRADMQVAMGKGKSITPTRVTLREVAEDFMAAAKSGAATGRGGRRYKPATLRCYELNLRERVLPELGALRLTEIRRSDLQALADRMKATGLAPSTVRNVLDPLRPIFRLAVREDLIAESPMQGVELEVAKGRRLRIADLDEAASLLDALPTDRALWATAFYAGLRRGELRGLRWQDVSLGKEEIRVERGWDEKAGPIEPKSAASERTVPIFSMLLDYLYEHKLRSGRDGEDLVFGRSAELPFGTSTIGNRAKKAWRGREPITLHDARHTAASLMIAAGINAKAIQTFMGHATITETFDRYGHLMPGNREEAREKMDLYLSECVARASKGTPEEPISAVDDIEHDYPDLAL